MYSETGVKVLFALGAIGVLVIALPFLYLILTGLLWLVTGHLYRL